MLPEGSSSHIFPSSLLLEFLVRDGFDNYLSLTKFNCSCWLLQQRTTAGEGPPSHASSGCVINQILQSLRAFSIYHFTAVISGCPACLLHAHSAEQDHILLSPCCVIMCSAEVSFHKQFDFSHSPSLLSSCLLETTLQPSPRPPECPALLWGGSLELNFMHPEAIV